LDTLWDKVTPHVLQLKSTNSSFSIHSLLDNFVHSEKLRPEDTVYSFVFFDDQELAGEVVQNLHNFFRTMYKKVTSIYLVNIGFKNFYY
jgi:hypothetical protein